MNPQMKEWIERSFKAPKELHFESSSRCNGACITCPREGMTRYQGEMSREIFLKGINEAISYGWNLDYFHFHLNGEPLYLPIDELVWRINYAKENLPRINEYPIICFFTNASLLTPEKSKKLLDSKLDKIVFSIDGGNKQAFETCRPGLHWETVISNIEEFMRLKKEGNYKIATQTALIPNIYNWSSMKEYYPLFQRMGIDDVGGSGVNNIGGLIDSKKLRLKAQYISGHKRSPCWRVFLDLSIMADGKACVCCQDVRGTTVVGDLNTQSLKEIWQVGMEKVRQIHIAMEQDKIEFCKDCDYMESFCEPDWWLKPKE